MQLPGLYWKVLWNPTEAVQIQLRTLMSNNILFYKQCLCGRFSSVLPEEQFEGESLYAYLLIKVYLRPENKYIHLCWMSCWYLKDRAIAELEPGTVLTFNNLGLKYSVMKNGFLFISSVLEFVKWLYLPETWIYQLFL